MRGNQIHTCRFHEDQFARGVYHPPATHINLYDISQCFKTKNIKSEERKREKIKWDLLSPRNNVALLLLGIFVAHWLLLRLLHVLHFLFAYSALALFLSWTLSLPFYWYPTRMLKPKPLWRNSSLPSLSLSLYGLLLCSNGTVKPPSQKLHLSAPPFPPSPPPLYTLKIALDSTFSFQSTFLLAIPGYWIQSNSPPPKIR